MVGSILKLYFRLASVEGDLGYTNCVSDDRRRDQEEAQIFEGQLICVRSIGFEPCPGYLLAYHTNGVKKKCHPLSIICHWLALFN